MTKALGCALMLVAFSFVAAGLLLLAGLLNAGAWVWEIVWGETR